MKRAHARAVGPVLPVHLGRRLHRLRIDIDDGVKRRTFQVVGLDAVEIEPGQLRAGELPACERRANVENRRLLKMKRRLRLRGRCHAKHRTDRRYVDEMTHHALTPFIVVRLSTLLLCPLDQEIVKRLAQRLHPRFAGTVASTCACATWQATESGLARRCPA